VLAAAWLLLGLTRLVTVVLPFRTVRRMLGESKPAGSARRSAPAGPVPPVDRRRARRIGALVSLAAERTPWRSECYPQALTTRLLLRAAGIAHHTSFGVRRVQGELVAHAWVEVDGETVNGGDDQPWTAVGSFGWTPRREGGR
jgi:hypothetical protein